MNECFTCGAQRVEDEFRYKLTDQGVSGSTYFSCGTRCLMDAAKSEAEFNADDDYLQPEE